MKLQISDLLPAADLAAVTAAMSDLGLYVDGARTAGARARAVKANLQARDCAATAALTARVSAALLANPLFQAAAQPKAIVRLLLSRCEAGMGYGDHVDAALMDGRRTDLSFTLFLSAPERYEGGALVIDGLEGQHSVKLPLNHLLLYPATSLHRVEPVVSGTRLAAVGWVRSLVRGQEQREILFDLANIAAGLARDGSVAALDPLAKVRANLLRLWAED